MVISVFGGKWLQFCDFLSIHAVFLKAVLFTSHIKQTNTLDDLIEDTKTLEV